MRATNVRFGPKAIQDPLHLQLASALAGIPATLAICAVGGLGLGWV